VSSTYGAYANIVMIQITNPYIPYDCL